MFNIIKLIAIFFSLQCCLRCEAVETKSNTKTYVQNFCKYSISLSEDWKLVGDESDIFEPRKIGGFYRYTPGPGRDVAAAQWLNTNEKQILDITAIKRQSGIGTGSYVKEVEHLLAGDIKICNRGTSIFKDQNSYWRIIGINDYYVYLKMFSNNDRFYCVTLTTDSEITPEKQAQFDGILSNIQYLE